jgi:cytochrome c biogenesis protein CcdA
LLSQKTKLLTFALLAVLLLVIVLWNAASTATTNPISQSYGGGAGLEKQLGAVPIYYESRPGLLQGNKTYVAFLYYSTCPTCEENEDNLFISKSYPKWQGNLSSDEISFKVINYYRDLEAGTAYFEAFNISKSAEGGSILVVHNSKVGLVYYPPFSDGEIRNAVYYLTKGSLAKGISDQNGTTFSQLLVFALGAISGFNPCLVALASVFFATANKTELKGVTRRIGLISIGLIYAYLIFFSLIVSNPVIMGSLVSISWVIVIVLLIMGLLYLIEAAQDIYSREWGSGSGIDAKIHLFRTPARLKGLIQKTKEMNSPIYDFGLGSLFSLVKLPCIAAFLIVLLVKSSTPLIDVTIFTFGVASPVILMGLLIGFGMMKVNQLSTAQFKGRVIQRILIGALLIISAFLVLK